MSFIRTTENWDSMATRLQSTAELRKRLKRAFDDAGVNPAEAAKMAGLPSANSICNLLSGRSRTLSVSTIEKLSRVVPTVAAALLGPNSAGLTNLSPRSVQVKAAAQAGKLLPSFDMPLDEQFEAPVPITDLQKASGAYGVVLRYPGFDKLYKDGSILVCMPMQQYEGSLASGARVILERIRNGKVEVTARELEVIEASAFLWLRSNNPHCHAPVMMPWPSDGTKMWKSGDDRFSVVGVVIGVWEPMSGD